MMKNNIKEVIESYMEQITEPFCSEADFQFSLALFLKEKLSEFEVEVILEYPVIKEVTDENGKKHHYNIYIDICLIDETNKTAKDKYYIELKYKTKKDTITRHGIDEIGLKNQMAQDLGRYFFVKDIQRIEQSADIKGGFCLLITNDHLYWDNSNKTNTMDKEFLIHDGHEIEWGKRDENYYVHSWRVEKCSKGEHWTEKYPELELKNNYKCEWKGCSEIKDKVFKYLLLQV